MNRIRTINRSFIVSLTLLAITILVAAGCAGITGSPEVAANNSKNTGFKVAMLLPGPEDDGGWSQAGYEGLKLIEKELGAETAFTANVTEEASKGLLRQYANKGYDFIIGHGGEYIPAAETVAKEFPRIKFAVIAGYAGNNKNFGALSFRDGEVGYLTGVVAALKTETGKVAYVGGEPYTHMKEQATLFERGAKATNPKLETSIEWVESWVDQDKAREIAQNLIESGVDVIVVDADTAGLAIHEVAQQEGIKTIGWALDQHELAPDTIVTSAIQRVPVLVLEGAILVQQGRWEGKQYKFGLQEGAQELAPFYGFLTSEEEAYVQAVHNDIIAGKINVSP